MRIIERTVGLLIPMPLLVARFNVSLAGDKIRPLDIRGEDNVVEWHPFVWISDGTGRLFFAEVNCVPVAEGAIDG